LGRMMLLDKAVLLVMPAKWDQFAHSFEKNRLPRAFLRLAPCADETAIRPEETILEKLRTAAAGQEKRALLEAHLQEMTARVLKTSADRIDRDKPLGSMGVDSLMALELVRRLSVTTGIRLPATAVFNHPTIVLLTSQIARRMGIALDEEMTAAARNGKTRFQEPPSNRAPAGSGISDEEAIAALSGQNRNSE